MSDFPCCVIDLDREAAELRLELAGLAVPARPVGKRFDIAETLLRAGYPADYVGKVAGLPADAVAAVNRTLP
jgi:hypothetical protein